MEEVGEELEQDLNHATSLFLLGSKLKLFGEDFYILWGGRVGMSEATAFEKVPFNLRKRVADVCGQFY